MSPAQSGDNPFGTWGRDEANLPCYVLSLRKLPPAFPVLRHHVANGCIHFLGDSAGRISIFAGPPGRSLRLSSPKDPVFSAVYLRLTAADGKASVLPAEGLAAGDGTLTWGVSYLRYEGYIRRQGGGLAFSFEIAVPRYASAGHVGFRLKNESDAPFEGTAEIVWELAPSPHEPDSPRVSLFQKEGIIIRPDLREDVGDFFLGGAPEWECAGKDSRLVLRAPVRLDPAAEVTWRFLLGTSPECSFTTVRDQYAETRPEAILTSWAETLMQRRGRAPELWMQQECLWCEGRLCGFLDARSIRNADAPGINPGGVRFFRGAGTRVRPPRGLASGGVREMLALTLPLVETASTQALAALDRVMRCQSSAGRIPELLEIRAGQGRVRPAADRSDIEISFLVAWAWFLRRDPAAAGLDQECPFSDGAPESRWEHMKRACDWVRHELGTGPHGLVRVLAGDSNGWLDRMGTSGRGESALNTARLIWALRPLIETARRREDPVLADRLEGWRRELGEAMAETFDGDRFARGYTDQGRPVGAGPNGPVFADVQAWAVLARCGTTEYRDKALRNVLEQCLTPTGITVLSTPYPPPPPADISSWSTCPGVGENGGISATVTAWMVWALADHGCADLGFRVWEAASLRRRTTGPDALPPALVGLTDCLNGPDCPLGAGLPSAVAENGGPWPEAAAFAWQAFGMRRLLEK